MTGPGVSVASFRPEADAGCLVHHLVVAALALPDVKEKLVALGADPVLNTPAQFADWIKSENAKWAAVVKKANLKVQ